MTYKKNLLRQSILAMFFATSAGAVVAQEVEIPAPKFDIKSFEVVGDTILGSDVVQRTVTPFTGKDKDFGDVQRALESLEVAYRKLGYGVIQVQLPEQDITRGVVRFNINQPKVGKVNVEGNQFFSTENVRRSLPSVKEGEIPNSNEIARDVSETLRKLTAAQYTAANPGQVCPAKWKEGAKTLAPSIDLVGKI